MSDTGYCQVQLQGVQDSFMSINIPVVTDTPWAIGGSYRKGRIEIISIYRKSSLE